MKRSEAVKILQKQIEKVHVKDFEGNLLLRFNWVEETNTYLKKFFGPNSDQSKKFDYDAWNEEKQGMGATNHDLRIMIATDFLESCIFQIKKFGVYKPPVENWFSKLPNWVINLGLPALCVISFTFGILFTNNNNKELREENSNLKKELLLISSDTIPDQHKDLGNRPKNK